MGYHGSPLCIPRLGQLAVSHIIKHAETGLRNIRQHLLVRRLLHERKSTRHHSVGYYHTYVTNFNQRLCYAFIVADSLKVSPAVSH
jgi:hypothetical protein